MADNSYRSTNITCELVTEQASHIKMAAAAKPVHSVESTHTNEEEELAKLSNEKRILASLISGALAGALAKTVIAPLDRTKINFQISKQPYSARQAYIFLQETYQMSGFTSLWRGNSATMARIVPYAAIQYCAFDQWRRVLSANGTNEHVSIKRFLAGSLAGVTSQTLTYPLDMARARLSVTHKDTYGSLHEVFKKIWIEEGPRTLYRGYVPTILGVIPYAGTSFLTYESLKVSYMKRHSKQSVNPAERMVFGAIAGLLGQSASYPLDIVRRRMQTARVVGHNDYKTVVGALKKVYREEGIRNGLYKGLSMNWVKGPIATGISFSTFETVYIFLSKRPYFQNK